MRGISVAILVCAVGLFVPVLAAQASTESVLYSFCSQQNCADGWNPEADLISLKGVLYGTTYWGGGTTNCTSGCGTVFSVNPQTGIETVLYSFQGDPDGGWVPSGLVRLKGALLGTTMIGGTVNDGTVFSVDPATRAETVVHSFGFGSDGNSPWAGLIDVKGTLYGTTAGGGSLGYGAVFSLNPTTGTERVLYSFCTLQNCADGLGPHAALVDVGGAFYGTTEGGGKCGNCGTIFLLHPETGAEKVKYSFCKKKGCPDGNYPNTTLTNLNGVLYGTTLQGGTYSSGVVFSFAPQGGVEKTLYSFCAVANCADGSSPDSGVISVNGTLYGTAPYGGAYDQGVVFSIDPLTGAETMVYSFCSQLNCTDGATPVGGLVDVNGTLYGTTVNGGANDRGTVFSIVP